MFVTVGSGNPVKRAATEAAFHDSAATDRFVDATVRAEPVDSGVSEQPRGHAETRRGAVTRAVAAHETGADLGVGIEGGVGSFDPVTTAEAVVGASAEAANGAPAEVADGAGEGAPRAGGGGRPLRPRAGLPGGGGGWRAARGACSLPRGGGREGGAAWARGFRVGAVVSSMAGGGGGRVVGLLLAVGGGGRRGRGRVRRGGGGAAADG